jgi:hypothetical protein
MALAASAPGLAAGAASTPTVKGDSGPLTATIEPGTHHPKVNTRWPLTVTATLHGKPARATSFYLYLLGSAQVGKEYPFGKNPYWFTGHYSDHFVWPSDSLAQPLTLQVVVSSAGHTVRLDWAVTTVQ